MSSSGGQRASKRAGTSVADGKAAAKGRGHPTSVLPLYCCATGCLHNTKTDRNLWFYRFPKRDHEQRRRWIEAVKPCGSEWAPKNELLCSAHFATGEKSNVDTHVDYAPTVFPAFNTAWMASSPSAGGGKKRPAPPEKAAGAKKKAKVVQTDDKSVQTSDEAPPSPSLDVRLALTSDEDFEAWTGVSRSQYGSLVGLTKVESLKMSKDRAVFLVLVKLKTNLSFAALGPLFGLSSRHARRLFSKVVHALHEGLRPHLPWLGHGGGRARSVDVPRGTRHVIIDSLELRIDVSRDVEPVCNGYEGPAVVKFLIVSGPCGEALFMSGAYGGDVADEVIIELSGILGFLSPNDVVIAEKEYPPIAGKVEKSGSFHVLPPGKTGDLHFTRAHYNEDGEMTVSGMKVHIERIMERLASFGILRCFHHSLTRQVDKVMSILAFITSNRDKNAFVPSPKKEGPEAAAVITPDVVVADGVDPSELVDDRDPTQLDIDIHDCKLETTC